MTCLFDESAVGLLFLTPVFEKLPNNALAAIVVAGLVSIFDYEEAIWLWKVGNVLAASCTSMAHQDQDQSAAVLAIP